MEVSELVGLWPQVLSLADEQELQKSDVLEALRSGEPIPPALTDRVMPLLADILDKKYKFGRGIRPKPSLNRKLITMYFEWLKKDLEVGDFSRIYDVDEQRQAELELKDKTPRSVALSMISLQFDISERQLEAYLKEQRTKKR